MAGGAALLHAFSGRLLRHAARSAAVTVGLSLASGSPAAVIEQLSTSTSYIYDFSPGLAGTHSGTGDNGNVNELGPNAAQATDVKFKYDTFALTDASFFFLHNIQCQGFCSVKVSTTVIDTISNIGSTVADLRLDSNITAGHFGLVQNAKSASSGVFQFGVDQDLNGTSKQLYQAVGNVSSAGATIVTSDGSVFNGLTNYKDPTQIGLDWDATQLSLALGLLSPGETTTVSYTTVTYLNSYGTCSDYNLCDGVQVAFGDPRNKGGVVGLRSFGLTAASAKQPVGYVLNREFDPAQVRLNVVDLRAVPEPASWMTMLLGFGAIGSVIRRRNASSAVHLG